MIDALERHAEQVKQLVDLFIGVEVVGYATIYRIGDWQRYEFDTDALD